MSKVFLTGLLAVFLIAFWTWRRNATPTPSRESFPVQLSDQQWRDKLSPAAYRVMRKESTEAPGSSFLNHEKGDGQFLCAGCQRVLFDSADKFESGTGWPSFVRPTENGDVSSRKDFALMMVRTEVHCAGCGGHLGHVFGDGPAPTGKRFCINGVALEFKPRDARAEALAGASPIPGP